MRIGICEWTTFPASFEDELAAYRAAVAGTFGNALPVDGLARRSVESLGAVA